MMLRIVTNCFPRYQAVSPVVDQIEVGDPVELKLPGLVRDVAKGCRYGRPGLL
jgi:hypothetical protein